MVSIPSWIPSTRRSVPADRTLTPPGLAWGRYSTGTQPGGDGAACNYSQGKLYGATSAGRRPHARTQHATQRTQLARSPARRTRNPTLTAPYPHSPTRPNLHPSLRPAPAYTPAYTHASRLTPRASRLAPHASRLTPRASRLAPHASRLTPQVLGPVLQNLQREVIVQISPIILGLTASTIFAAVLADGDAFGLRMMWSTYR